MSTEEQKEAGNSLPAQKTRLKNYCQRKDLTIIKEFSFDESAYKTKRDDFDLILDFVKEQKEKIIVCFDKVDRLSRNIFDIRVSELYEKALKDEIELHFVSDNQVINSQISASEKFRFSMNLGLAKYYSDAISDNVKRVQEQKLRDGIYPSKATFGYDNVDLENGKKWIEINPSNAQVVQKMFEWYSTASFSLSEIRLKLKEVFDISFSKGNVDRILKNPFYCGTMVYNGQEYPHGYDRIISKDLFDKVQEIKAGFHKKHFKYAGLPFLYRGLIRCAECGCSITPERKTKKSGKTYHYYHCTQYNGKHNAEWLTEDDLTKQFSDTFSRLQMPQNVVDDITDTLKTNHQAKSNFHKGLLDRYQADYQLYEQRIEKMYEDKLDGSITVSLYEKKREEYRQKQKEVESKTARLRLTDEQYYITAEYLLKVASKAKELFESSEPQEKRLLLKMTLQNPTLNGKKVCYNWIKPFDTIADYSSRSLWLRRRDSNSQLSD